jgi:hypothetical protein
MPSAVLVGVLVLLWAATAGPVAMLGPSSARPHFEPATPSPSASPSASPPPDPLDELRRQPPQRDLSWVGDLIGWTFVIAVLAGLVLGLAWLWRHRWRRPPAPPELDIDVLPDVRAVSAALGDDADTQLARLGEGDVRNGIVRCWLRLEDVIAGAGLPRDPAETSTEFTVRVLHALDLDPRAIGGLARLYREARFSEHPLDESARGAAQAMLAQLHADVRTSGAPTAGGAR